LLTNVYGLKKKINRGQINPCSKLESLYLVAAMELGLKVSIGLTSESPTERLPASMDLSLTVGTLWLWMSEINELIL